MDIAQCLCQRAEAYAATRDRTADQKLMNKEQIFEVIKKNVLEILPDIDPTRIVVESSLRDLGANSIDRADILIQSQEELKLKFPLHEMGAARNLQGLVDIFSAKMNHGHL
ncbi:MAG: acyl carrier protein [Verrucomicrobiales bacterium]|nr:acyl carrier protein [Verrucomicrobiales bacterium]